MAISNKITETGNNNNCIYRVARKNAPNLRIALCNRVGEMNQQKSMYVMSKHIRIHQRIFT